MAINPHYTQDPERLGHLASGKATFSRTSRIANPLTENVVSLGLKQNTCEYDKKFGVICASLTLLNVQRL